MNELQLLVRYSTGKIKKKAHKELLSS